MMEFVYDSADAAGQNAVTVTTWYACDWAKERIAQECPDINIREYYIETKFSGRGMSLGGELKFRPKLILPSQPLKVF